MNVLQLINKLWKLQLIKYLIVASVAFVIDALVYFICYNYIFKSEIVFIKNFEIRAAIISLVISFTFGFIVNFILSKYLVFKKTANTTIQFFRFLLSACLTFVGNYLLMHFLLTQLKADAFFARCIAALTFAIISFLAHKLFSFKN